MHNFIFVMTEMVKYLAVAKVSGGGVIFAYLLLNRSLLKCRYFSLELSIK